MKRRQVLIDRSDGRSLRSGFLASVASTPENPALVVRSVSYSYETLERTARTWAHGVLELAGGQPERIGVFAHRSEVAYAGVLASLFAGAAFVPLNPEFPADRTRAMIELAELDAIVVEAELAAQLGNVLVGVDPCPPILGPQETFRGCPGVDAPILRYSDLQRLGPVDQLPPVCESDVAYLLFTSGSTGQPKGVPVTHTNVLHFIDVMTERYHTEETDRFSQTFDQTFDLSVFDLFMPWERGACLCSMQKIDLLAPARYVSRQGVTVWFSVPSIPALMRKKGSLKPGVFPNLRLSLFCGEPLSRSSAEAWQAAAPSSVVENLYGPTELTIACLVHRWSAATSTDMCINDIVPIGRPFSGLGVVVLNEGGEPSGPGEEGELCVCGPQTVPGYWKDEAKTSERFFELASEGPYNLRFYRTGDRVRRVPGGDYVYLGRTDHQIKVLGHRVELGEVEAVLNRGAGVSQAAALGWPKIDGSAEGVVAFVSGCEIDGEALAVDAQRHLPDYMVPKKILVVDEMPLNVNGKIDRNALERVLTDGGCGAASP